MTKMINTQFVEFDASAMTITAPVPDTYDDLETMFVDTLKVFLETQCTEYTPEDCGFHDRVYGKVWIDGSDTCMVVDSEFSAYYSGMSYVSDEATRRVGRYTIYSAIDSRVQEHIDIGKGNQDEEDGDEE